MFFPVLSALSLPSQPLYLPYFSRSLIVLCVRCQKCRENPRARRGSKLDARRVPCFMCSTACKLVKVCGPCECVCVLTFWCSIGLTKYSALIATATDIPQVSPGEPYYVISLTPQVNNLPWLVRFVLVKRSSVIFDFLLPLPSHFPFTSQTFQGVAPSESLSFA